MLASAQGLGLQHQRQQPRLLLQAAAVLLRVCQMLRVALVLWMQLQLLPTWPAARVTPRQLQRAVLLWRQQVLVVVGMGWQRRGAPLGS
jgi:hypothetical protein